MWEQVPVQQFAAPTGVPGTFNYNLVSVAFQSAPACTNSITGTATITVNSTPAATISGTTTVCKSSTAPNITFTNPQALPVTITYNVNGGANTTINVGANTSATVAAPTGAPGTFNYNLVSVAYQSAPSCSSSVTGTATVTVLPAPAASISGTSTVCKNDPSPTITFTNPLSLDETITYNINGGANTTINVLANSTGTVLASTGTAGTFNYNLVSAVFQTAPTCSNTIAGTAKITVSALPTGTLIATENSGTANDNIICTTATVTFTATSGFGSYIFKVNGITVQSGTSNTYSTNTLTNGASVTVDVANAFNCGATFGPVVIIVNPLPVAGLTADKTTICPGDNVTFTATGGTNFIFKVNGSSVQSGASNIYSSTSLTNGASVTVDVTDANGCSATSAPPVVITVNAVPTGTLSASATTICVGDNIIFTATARLYHLRI